MFAMIIKIINRNFKVSSIRKIINKIIWFVFRFSVTLEHPFRDKYIFYRFTIDAESELQSRSWYKF